jgi:hypothetical protein
MFVIITTPKTRRVESVPISEIPHNIPLVLIHFFLQWRSGIPERQGTPALEPKQISSTPFRRI